MKTSFKTFTLLLVATSMTPAMASLEDLFLKSLKKSKKVEIISLTEEKTLADLNSTVSTMYPDLDLVSNNRYGNDTNQEFSNLEQVDTDLALSVEQKVFQGGAEFALLDLKKIVPKKAHALTDQELSAYFAQFSAYYFQYSSALDEKEKVQRLLKNLEKRVKIVRQRTKIGRDRKADLLALESQLARLKADLSTTESTVSSARTNFLNFSNLESVDEIKDQINPLKLKLPSTVSLEKIPELKNLKYEHESSEAQAKIARSAYLPQVSLGANYYLDKTYSGRDDWDVSLNIKMNLFDFGKTASSVQSAKVAARIDKARYDYSRMNADGQWKNFVKNFNLKKDEYRSLQKALDRSTRSYDEQIKDLNKGLITQIDAIRSLDDVITLQKLAIKSSLELKSLYYQANAYLGKYPKL
ncbi:MAG: TolC family protein [Bacteriovoracaceae bacterium]|nr:TolC family protein [Bacteriovoracaceae bacterium]